MSKLNYIPLVFVFLASLFIISLLPKLCQIDKQKGKNIYRELQRDIDVEAQFNRIHSKP